MLSHPRPVEQLPGDELAARIKQLHQQGYTRPLWAPLVNSYETGDGVKFTITQSTLALTNPGTGDTAHVALDTKISADFDGSRPGGLFLSGTLVPDRE